MVQVHFTETDLFECIILTPASIEPGTTGRKKPSSASAPDTGDDGWMVEVDA